MESFGAVSSPREKAVSLRPQHISTYELTVEKETELYRLLNTPSPRHPLARGRYIEGIHEDQIIHMYEEAI